MPHTNRKKKSNGEVGFKPKPKFAQTRRQEIEDDEGWTHVVDAKKTLNFPEVKEIGIKKPWDGDFVSGDNAITTMDLAEIEAEHKRYRDQWEASEACTQLKGLLAAGSGGVAISNVVCLGLGTLQDWKLQSRRTSHVQLAALQTITAVLGIESVPRFAQEPHFTELDKQFMKSMNYEIVEDPEAFSKISENSLVYAVHCYPALYQSIGRQGRPALLIGNDLKGYIDKLCVMNSTTPLTLLTEYRSRDADSQEIIEDLARLIKGSNAADFPQNRYDFTDTKIYTHQA
jgi:hypothetical protein